ncbi:MAG: hypothetical protein WBC87_16990, partial [Pseudolabrys sp.]
GCGLAGLAKNFRRRPSAGGIKWGIAAVPLSMPLKRGHLRTISLPGQGVDARSLCGRIWLRGGITLS